MNFGWRGRVVLFLQTRSIEAYREEMKRVREERKATVVEHLEDVLEAYENPEAAIHQFYTRTWDYERDLVDETLEEYRRGE